MSQLTKRMLVLVVVTIGLIALLGVMAPPGVGAADESIDCSFPVTVTDATGEELTLESPPEDVVTVAPSAAQIMWEIGAEEQVTGVSMHAYYLEGTEDRVNISADPMSIDIEQVVVLEPDLVLAPNATPQEEVNELRRVGIDVYHYSTATSVDDIIDHVLVTGTLVDACDGAEETVTDMNDRLEAIESALADIDERQTVYFEMGGGWTAGEGTFQHIALETAGLDNIAIEADVQGWEPVSTEFVLEQDPDWIVYSADFPEPPVADALAATTAMERNQTVQVESNNISQPAPRIVDAIEDIHSAVYGDLAEDSPEEDAEATPGFGIAVAIAAGGMLMMLAYRYRKR